MEKLQGLLIPPEGMRRPDFITPRGKQIWYDMPDKTLIELEDLLPSFPYIYRYVGGLPVNLTLHTCIGIQLAKDPATKAYFAVHDFHEAIVGEVVRYLKPHIEFKRIENPWEDHVHKSLGFMDKSKYSPIINSLDTYTFLIEVKLFNHPAANDYIHFYNLTPEQIDDLIFTYKFDRLAKIIEEDPALGLEFIRKTVNRYLRNVHKPSWPKLQTSQISI